MSYKPQTKWIVNVKTPEGKLRTEIFKFQPKMGQKLADGSIVIKVS